MSRILSYEHTSSTLPYPPGSAPNLIPCIAILLVIAIVCWALCGAAVKLGSHSKTRLKDIVRYPRSKSEAKIIQILENLTGEKFPTVYPSWLVWRGHQLELDGYCKKLRLALEFSGPQHTQWIPVQEAYPIYYGRIVRDRVKVILCAKHRIKLIVVDVSLPRVHWQNYLKSRLHDVGILSRPDVYIDEQSATPFRNIQLEAEYELSDMEEVEALAGRN